jgi:hypothetical protein
MYDNNMQQNKTNFGDNFQHKNQTSKVNNTLTVVANESPKAFKTSKN